MASAPLKRMTVDEFRVWAETQPERKFELDAGEPLVEPKRGALHCLAKGDIAFALSDSIHRTGLPCHVFMDGMMVRVDDQTAYIPDAIVYVGPRMDGDEVLVPNPVVVVEVASPMPCGIDTGAKLAGYFKVASVRHYLVVDPTARLIIHHARQTDTTILTRIATEGAIDLTPPGLALDLADVFPSP